MVDGRYIHSIGGDSRVSLKITLRHFPYIDEKLLVSNSKTQPLSQYQRYF